MIPLRMSSLLTKMTRRFHEDDASVVLVTVFGGEAQVRAKATPDLVAIQDFHGRTLGQQLFRQGLRNGGLA